MAGSDWLDQKTALFIADTLELSARLRELNQKILKHLEASSTVLDSPQEEVQPKHLSDDQSTIDRADALDDQLMLDSQTQQCTDRKVIYLLLPKHLLLKHDRFSHAQDGAEAPESSIL